MQPRLKRINYLSFSKKESRKQDKKKKVSFLLTKKLNGVMLIGDMIELTDCGMPMLKRLFDSV